jgi:hypothetical protein
MDAHTNSKFLTYDFFLQGSSILQSADFDLSHERRLLTSHGNILAQNFKLFDKLPSDPLAFGIQAVDNSFHAIFQPNGLCVGTVSECPLLESEATLVQVCPFEVIKFVSPLYRSGALKDVLIEKGIDPERVEVDGKGMREPLNSNKTETDRALNRRVVLTILYD